jgi:hypothetical protein
MSKGEIMITFVLACMLSSYHIGNSLINDGLGNKVGDTQGLEAIAEQHGHELQLGYHIDSSQAMHSIWDNPNGVGVDGIDLTREPYNDYTNALTNYDWNAVLLEPYLSQSATFGSDRTTIGNFVGLVDNPQTAIYIYQVWPRQSWGNYGDYWNQTTAIADTTASRPRRQYYTELLQRVKQDNPGQVIRQVLTGEVWYRLSELIEDGTITEATMPNLYRDDLHASGLGRYVAAATIFSTLYRQPLTELPPVEFFGTTYSPDLYQLINTVIWDVVSNSPDSGVGDFNDDGVIDSNDLAQWQALDLGGRQFLHWQRNFNGPLQQSLMAGPIIPGREGRLPEPGHLLGLFFAVSTYCALRRTIKCRRALLLLLAISVATPCFGQYGYYRPYYGPTNYVYYGGWYPGSYNGLYGNYGYHHVIYRYPVYNRYGR